jgi:hypothetical protein
LYQVAQSSGQYTPAYAEPGLKLTEAAFAIERIADDQKRPPVPDCIKGTRNRATGIP